jgi:hypothetical protein
VAYAALRSFRVGLFGITYGWLTLLLSLSAQVSGRIVVLAGGDLLLAAIWFCWLFDTRRKRD